MHTSSEDEPGLLNGPLHLDAKYVFVNDGDRRHGNQTGDSVSTLIRKKATVDLSAWLFLLKSQAEKWDLNEEPQSSLSLQRFPLLLHRFPSVHFSACTVAYLFISYDHDGKWKESDKKC